MNTLKKINIQELEGFQIGNAEYRQYKTGCTVILAKNGATTGVDIRGGGPASRESGLLNPLAANDAIHAILLSGGSAYGLNAAGGVMKYLEERKIGFSTDDGVVPIVCASCIYDLEMEYAHRPDAELAYLACQNVGNYKSGNYGAGTGATVGKAKGPASMMKSGIGSAAFQLGNLKVGAVMVVNAMGDIFDYQTAKKIAGVISYDTKDFESCEDILYSSLQPHDNTNTTIGVIFTNASFNKTELTKIASMGHDGMARAINPVHTQFDGDTLYAMSKGSVQADINMVGMLAAKAVSEAIMDAVISADPEFDLLSYKSLQK